MQHHATKILEVCERDLQRRCQGLESRPAQHTARGPHEARESFSCGPRELSQLQKMLRKLDLE